MAEKGIWSPSRQNLDRGFLFSASCDFELPEDM